MKIAIAQTKPEKGNILYNIERHKILIDHAVSLKAEAIIFPELSITGYEPRLASTLCLQKDDKHLSLFQDICNAGEIVIGIGFPAKTNKGVQIGMMIYQPYKSSTYYAKQILHTDEEPYFISGSGQTIIIVNNKAVIPAICYESLQPWHIEQAKKVGGDIYAASVAKSYAGIGKAYKYYSIIARQYAIPVVMSNCVGFCDNFESAGLSAVWNSNGDIIASLDKVSEGIIVFDAGQETAIKYIL